MAKRIERKDIIAEDVEKGILSVVAALDKLKVSLIEIGKATETQLKQKGPDSAKSLKAQAEAMDKAKIVTQELNKAEQARVRALAQLEVARKNEFKDIREANLAKKLQVKLVDQELAERSKLLDAYERERALLNRLNKEYKASAAQYGINSKEARKLKNELDPLRNKLKEINQSAGQFQENVGNYPKGISRLGDAVKNIAGSLGIIAGIGAAIQVIRSSINVFKEFDTAVSGLGAVTGATSDQLAALREQAKQLGATTAFTASQVVELQTEFAKLGFTVEQIQGVTGATLDFAAALDAGLGESAAFVGSTLRGFGLDVSETNRVVDVLAASTVKSSLDFNKLTNSLATVAPVANNAGVSIETTVAQLGTLTNAGIDASTAGTGLRNVYLRLAEEGITLEDAFNKILNATDKNAEALKLFGTRGATIGVVLAKMQKETAGLEAGLNDVGIASRIASDRLDNLEGDLKILQSAWEGFILSIEDGEGVINGILRGVTQLAAKALSLASSTSDLSYSTEELIKKNERYKTTIIPLADRLDELKSKSNLSVKENEELRKIIAKLTEEVPLAATAFDKYGNAIDVSTEKIRTFAKEQDRLLKIELRQELNSLFDQQDRLLKRLADTSGKVIENADGTFSAYIENQKEGIKTLQQISTERAISIQKRFLSEKEFQRGELSKIDKEIERVTKLLGFNFDKASNDAGGKIIENIVDGIKENQEKVKKEVSELFENVAVNIKPAFLDEEEVRKAGEKSAKAYYEAIEKEEKEFQARLAGKDRKAPTGIEGVDDVKSRKDALKEREEFTKETISLIEAITDKIVEASERRQEAIENEIDAHQKRLDSLRDLAAQGNLDAEQSLAEEQRRIAELEAQRQREIKRQEQAEFGIAALNSFSGFVNQGDEPASALGKTIVAMQALTAFIQAFPGFIDGTENVGDSVEHSKYKFSRGQDGYFARFDGDERILNPSQNKKIGAMSNEELANLAYNYQNGSLFSPEMVRPKIDVIQSQWQSNDEILRKFESLEKAVKDNKPADVRFYYDTFSDSFVKEVRRNNRIEKHHNKKGGIWG